MVLPSSVDVLYMTDANVADRVEDEVRARLKGIDGQAARCLCTGADGADRTGGCERGGRGDKIK